MTSKRRLRRAEIARAAVRLLSSEGVNNVRLADIGERLGMTAAHVLYYFEGKNDLFMAALRTVEEDFRAQILDHFASVESARERWDWLLDVGAPNGLDDSGLLMWLEGWAGAVHQKDVLELVTELEGEWQQLLRDTLGYAVERGELPGGLDLDLVCEGVSSLLDGITIRVVVGYRPVDHARAMQIVKQFTEPLLPWQNQHVHLI